MTEKKDPKRQLLGKIAKARGKQFESRIDDSFAYYAQKGFAIIEKTPEPMHPTKNLGNGKFIAYYEKQAQPDYKGTIKGGRTVMFEAKFTAADRMEQSRVLQSQQDYMDRHQALGARCFVIAGFSSGMVYCVPWDIWKTMKDHFGRKYVTEADLELSGKYSRWDIWQDFIIMSAIAIANTMGGPQAKAREEMYRSRAEKYSAKELEVFVDMLLEVVAELERDPEQDFLGELFMALGLGNEWKGQFFTPYSVCRAMSAMTYAPDMTARIEKQGWISVNDPACGAGALLVAFANECRRQHINYQTSVLFVAQDIDFLAGCMCYIQLSLLGCPGYVVIDDSLLRPSTSYDARGLLPKDGPQVWYTPMYFRDVWHYRRIGAQMDILFRNAAEQVPAEPPAPAAPPEQSQPLAETKTGQLTLF